jgi:SAM-dependent methyltransferase
LFWQRFLYKDSPELLDREGLSERGLALHHDLERFNRRMGWTQRHLRAVEQWWVALGSPSPFRILDVGAGTGAFLEALCDWGDERGIALQAEGVDLQPGYVAHAQARLNDRARVFVGDARCLEGHWDLATCTLTLHHIPPAERAGVVAGLARSCRATYLYDLERTLYAWSLSPVLFKLTGLGRDASADGMLSIRRSCTYREFTELVAPLPGRPRRVFPSSMSIQPDGPVPPT